ncbi:MAG: hypothetical protein CVV42_08575 [Candidatus Riflebacteria bacterium HGW-Riflebacteria-2]|jgi:hypothetical protein|nr:MAG: hypothetical protein CVV42_08575 [Candidatus Riflebacteria bacterium HGW-Riflebacteria-2]
MARILYLMLLLAIIAGAPALAGEEKPSLQLSGNEIDLLVGTPVGVEEPLDTRRTRVDESVRHDFSNLLEEDFNSESDLAEISWSDAEDAAIDPDQAESMLIDLLSETGELEGFDFSEDGESDEANSIDNVETEFKL